MADINKEVVGEAMNAEKKAQNRAKLEYREFRYKTSISDEFYARAHFQEFFRRTNVQLVILLAVAMVAQSLLSGTFTNPDVGWFAKGSVVLVALLSFFVMPMLAKTRWEYMKNNNDFWVENQRYILNGKGISVSSKHGDRRLQWKEVRRIFESDEAIVFSLYKFHMVVLPMNEFESNEKQRIRELIYYYTRTTRIKPKLNNKRR